MKDFIKNKFISQIKNSQWISILINKIKKPEGIYLMWNFIQIYNLRKYANNTIKIQMRARKEWLAKLSFKSITPKANIFIHSVIPWNAIFIMSSNLIKIFTDIQSFKLRKTLVRCIWVSLITNTILDKLINLENSLTFWISGIFQNLKILVKSKLVSFRFKLISDSCATPSKNNPIYTNLLKVINSL